MSNLFKINLDLAGAVASFICALHCIAIPIVLSLGIANSSHWLHDHTFDVVIICIGVVIASLSLVSDLKKHHSYLPLFLVLLGFSVLSIGIFNHDYSHTLLSVAGSSMVISAHYINWRKSTKKASF
jgi:hypothetical protein